MRVRSGLLGGGLERLEEEGFVCSGDLATLTGMKVDDDPVRDSTGVALPPPGFLLWLLANPAAQTFLKHIRERSAEGEPCGEIAP